MAKQGGLVKQPVDVSTAKAHVKHDTPAANAGQTFGKLPPDKPTNIDNTRYGEYLEDKLNQIVDRLRVHNWSEENPGIHRRPV